MHNKIILLMLISFSLSSLLTPATAQNAAYALMDKIESFEEQRGPDTTPEDVANFYAKMSEEILKLPWEALQLIRKKCKDPAFLMLFPDVHEFEYDSFLLHIKHTIQHRTYKGELVDAKFILINTNTQTSDGSPIHALILEIFMRQKLNYFCIYFESYFRINREKQGSFSDFIVYVLKKQEEWIAEDPVKWAISDY